MNSSKTCFFISPIGDTGGVIRRRADGILNEIVRPAFENAGYAVERADHDKTPGVVTEAIINKIIDSDLVVADLSDLNPNVMYELAVRHATGQPVIQMMEQGQSPPFDVSGVHTIFFVADLAGRDQAIRDLQKAEAAIETSTDLGNPIKRAVTFGALQRQATTDTQEELIQIVLQLQEELSFLRRQVSAQRSPLSAPPQLGRVLTAFHEPLSASEVVPSSTSGGVSSATAHHPRDFAGICEQCSLPFNAPRPPPGVGAWVACPHCGHHNTTP